MKQEQFLKRTETLCDEHKFEIVENPDYHGISRSRIHLRCRECGHKFYWNTSHLGQNMRCPNCKRKYKLSQEMAENIVARQCKQKIILNLLKSLNMLVEKHHCYLNVLNVVLSK